MPVFAFEFLSMLQNLYSMSERGRNLRNKTLISQVLGGEIEDQWCVPGRPAG